MKRLLASALFIAPLLAAAAPVNLLTNGSFESGAVNAGSYTLSGSLTGWSVGSNGIEIRNGVAGTAFDGVKFAELDTTGNSSISQSFATVAGATYELSFAYANRPDHRGAASNGLGWSIGSLGGTVGNNALTQWQTFTTTFTGTGSAMTLNFAGLGVSDSYGTSLDAVRVSAIPEPQSLALMLLGLGAMGVVLRRRKG